MKIITWNINGLDACLKKGLLNFIIAEGADFYCFQEVRARRSIPAPGYTQFWNLADRKGYSGTLILARHAPISVSYDFTDPSLCGEGRLIALEYADFILVNAYVPNSQSSLDRLAYRQRWDNALYEYMTTLPKPTILCGDFNVARTYIDVYPENLRNEKDPPGFVPAEREALERLIDAGFTDVFRYKHPTQEGEYTWWSNRLHKREANRGWRLDYFLVSDSLCPHIKSICHNADVYGSDHCPVTLKLKDTLISDSESSRTDRMAAAWDALDWPALEEELLLMQQSLTKAVFARNDDLRVDIQKQIVRSFAAKALAVRHVANIGSTPGIDGVKWTSSADKMRAALSLTSKNYRHQPYRRIEVTESGKRNRFANVPTAYDKAMQVLYAYSLDPVAEATGDRKSFAFRKGRSMYDCHAYICKAFSGPNPPNIVIRGDVKACYDSISHQWLLDNIPMDTKVLRRFIKAGAVFNGALFPTEVGISLGASLSPILGNMVLDGLQKYIFQELYGCDDIDYANGNLIRFADDFIITAQTYEDAERILDIVQAFLQPRGLTLSPIKTQIVDIKDGFVFLSRHYQRKNGVLVSEPSEQAVANFERSLSDLVLSFRGSQETLIKSINRKLSGWGNYHRVTDAHDAFRRVDAVVQSLLVRYVRNLHPKRQWGHLQAKYWYKNRDDEYIYALPNNRAIQVQKLAKAVITTHKPVKTNFNPYLDKDYYRALLQKREISKVSGSKLRGIWNRQNGQCYFCGQAMLPDHEITLAPVSFTLDERDTRYAYVHQSCADAEDIAWSHSDETDAPVDVAQILDGVTEIETAHDDPYCALREFFRMEKRSPVTLTFREIECIIGDALDWEAYFFPAFWYDEAPGFSGELWAKDFPFASVSPGKRDFCIAQAWLSQGYAIQRLRIEERRVVFRKEVHDRSGLKIPKALTEQRLPKDAVYELDEFFKYIIKKYGLQK